MIIAKNCKWCILFSFKWFELACQTFALYCICVQRREEKKKRTYLKHVSKNVKKGHSQCGWSGCVERVLNSQPHEWIIFSITWHWAQSAKDYLIYAIRFMPWYAVCVLSVNGFALICLRSEVSFILLVTRIHKTT